MTFVIHSFSRTCQRGYVKFCLHLFQEAFANLQNTFCSIELCRSYYIIGFYTALENISHTVLFCKLLVKLQIEHTTRRCVWHKYAAGSFEVLRKQQDDFPFCFYLYCLSRQAMTFFSYFLTISNLNVLFTQDCKKEQSSVQKPDAWLLRLESQCCYQLFLLNN